MPMKNFLAKALTPLKVPRKAPRTLLILVILLLTVFELTSVLAKDVVTRGPYLQMGTPTSIIIRWRTELATDSLVRMGPSVGALNLVASDGVFVTNHELKIQGLTPNTKYFYSIETSSKILAGNDNTHFFVTPPDYANTKNTRIWILGDSGTANSNAAAVKNAFLTYNSNTPPDVWLMLGDNAYNNGTDMEYQAAVFDMYPTLLRQTVLWSTLGNHDARSANTNNQSGVYFDVFNFPKNGEANGTASGTEAYYSFDYSNIHFVSLDSMDTDRSSNGAMMTWLDTDLSNTIKEWIIVFFHHPPYTKGSHDSDNVADSAGRLRDMREIFLPVLENYGVDLVLGGHSHAYERSFLLNGHYGSSDTLQASMIIDKGDGRSDGDGAYKNTSEPSKGTIYAVAGSSGKVGGGAVNHPAMYIGLKTLGSLIIDIKDSRLDAAFLNSSGALQDHFSIIKTATSNIPPVANAGPDIQAVIGEAVLFDASSSTDSDGTIDSYTWSNGLSGQKATKVYTAAGTYQVSLTVIDNSGATAIDDMILTVVDSEIPTTKPESKPSKTGSLQIFTLLALLLFAVARRDRQR